MKFESTELAITNLEQAYRESITQIVEPAPDMTVAEWADKYRWIIHGTAFPGKWSTDFTPYMRECMEVISDPFIRKVTLMFSSQIGKTELLLNIIGYYIHLSPSYMMIVYPTGDAAKKFAKERIAGLLLDNPFIEELIEADQQIQYKQFPGGSLDVVTARSPSELASKAIKILLLDEVDRMDPSAGNEGDPIELAIRRTTSYWDSKVVLVSSPGDKSTSRIEPSYKEGDMRKYHVPCPHCQEFQEFLWANCKCDLDDEGHRISSTAYFECIHCKERIEESSKREMIVNGKWIPTSVGDPSFHLNAFYSPMPGASWSSIVKIHQEANNMHDIEKLKQWTNTLLGETWEDVGDTVDPDSLLSHIENYESEIPDGVKVLVAGVDTQKDRIEVAIWGIGTGYEKWLIHTEKIILDPMIGNLAWTGLKDILERQFVNAKGKKFRVRIAAIDHGYSLTKIKVEYFVNAYKGPLKIIAVKGLGGPADHYLQRPRNSKHGEFHPYIVRTDPIKDMIYHSYAIDEPGPGYLHLLDVHNADEIVQQLTGEEKRTKIVKGQETKFWRKTRRNEQLDMLVYAIAALTLFGSGTVAKIIGSSPTEITESAIEDTPKTPKREEKQPDSLLKQHLRRRMPQSHKKNPWAGWGM